MLVIYESIKPVINRLRRLIKMAKVNIQTRQILETEFGIKDGKSTDEIFREQFGI